MPFVDKHIQEEANLAKRLISSIFFDTLITAAMMIAHWSLKSLSTLLGVDNEPGFSWINSISQLEGIYITWMLTRYNVVNPIWLRPQEQTENYDSGLKGMLFKLNKKPASHPIPSLS